MSFVAKLYRNATDLFDISLGLRVAPGEGFDPFDSDIIDPQFADTSIGEGSSLFSTRYPNREMQFPVHIQSSKYGYANTKDGLNSLLSRLSFILQNAWRVEWADDNATKSTWFDVVAARFEPEANFRRQQANWMSGVIRVWVRPFGHTATERIIGSVAATNPIALIPSAAIAGDIPAMLDIKISYGNPLGLLNFAAPTTPFSIISGWGITNVGSYSGFIPAATLKARATVTLIDVFSTPTLAGASGAAGSQACRVFLQYANSGDAIGVSPHYSQFLTTINRNELDFGRNRVFGLFRVPSFVGSGPTASIAFVVANRQVAGPDNPELNENLTLTAPTTSIVGWSNFQKWRVIDLGIINNGTGALESANPIVDQIAFNFIGMPASMPVGSFTTATVDFGGMVILPEDTTVLTVDAVGATSPNTALGYNASAVAATYEYLQTSNQFTRALGPTDALRMVRTTEDMLRGVVHQHIPCMPTSPTEQVDAQRVFGFALVDGGPQNGVLRVEAKVRERFTYQR